MKRVAFLLLPALLGADNLKSLLAYASAKSDLVVAKSFTQDAKNKELQAQKSAYYPTLDLGAFYQRLDEKSPFLPGETYSGFAKVGLSLYDGGMSDALVDTKSKEFKASNFDTEATKKELALSIVQEYFNIKTLEATLQAQEEERKSLGAQLSRVKQFFVAKLATQDAIDRLQAAYDTNVYESEATKLQLLGAKKMLALKVGKDVLRFEDSFISEPLSQSFEQSDGVKSLVAQKESLESNARALMSTYYPALRVEDTYSLNGYGSVDSAMPSQPDQQNKLMVTLGVRLFDNGAVEKNKEAVLSQAQALSSQIAYRTKEQKLNFEIAQARINTSKVAIASATSALKAAQSAFGMIEQKYNAGIVDNVAYLDALASLTHAKALHVKAVNDAQIAYGTYYFYSGKNIGEFVK